MATREECLKAAAVVYLNAKIRLETERQLAELEARDAA